MALTTLVNRMAAFAAVKKNAPTQESSAGQRKNRIFKPIDDWKFVRDGNEFTKTVNNTQFHWCPFHYEHGMWTTHASGTCGREHKHVPSKYDPIIHESQWNKRNQVSNSSSSTSANTSTTSNVNFQLDTKLQSALCTLSDTTEFDSAAFLAAYGIEDESKNKWLEIE